MLKTKTILLLNYPATGFSHQVKIKWLQSLPSFFVFRAIQQQDFSASIMYTGQLYQHINAEAVQPGCYKSYAPQITSNARIAETGLSTNIYILQDFFIQVSICTVYMGSLTNIQMLNLFVQFQNTQRVQRLTPDLMCKFLQKQFFFVQTTWVILYKKDQTGHMTYLCCIKKKRDVCVCVVHSEFIQHT